MKSARLSSVSAWGFLGVAGGLAALALTVFSSGCNPDIPPVGAAPVDGVWTFNIETESNACNFVGWEVGGRAPMQVLFFQEGMDSPDLTARAGGVAWLGLFLSLGTGDFSGTIRGRNSICSCCPPTGSPGRANVTICCGPR